MIFISSSGFSEFGTPNILSADLDLILDPLLPDRLFIRIISQNIQKVGDAMAKMPSVDVNLSTVSSYSFFERDLRPFKGLTFRSAFLYDSPQGPVIQIVSFDYDEPYPASSVGVDEGVCRAEQINPGNVDPLTCRVCNKKFAKKSNVKVHMNLHSENPKSFACKICGRAFNVRGHSKSHEYTHMNSEELSSLNIFHEECKICLLVFFDRREYDVHLNMHEKSKTLECQDCSKQFVTKHTLNRHMLSQHGDEETKKKIRDSLNFKCPFPNCTAKFPAKSKLERHSHTHATNKEFKCAKCDKLFQTPNSRNLHAKVHQVNCAFKCYFCQKNFSNSFVRNSHMKRHFQEFDFRCEICRREFMQKGNLKRHMSRVHRGLGPHPCPHCRIVFPRNSDLNMHLEKAHQKFDKLKLK